MKSGTSNLTADGKYTQTSSINAIVLHKDYKHITSVNDIAIVKLETPLVFDDYVNRVCIPDATNVEEYKYGRCYVAGYDERPGRKHLCFFASSLVKLFNCYSSDYTVNLIVCDYVKLNFHPNS